MLVIKVLGRCAHTAPVESSCVDELRRPVAMVPAAVYSGYVHAIGSSSSIGSRIERGQLFSRKLRTVAGGGSGVCDHQPTSRHDLSLTFSRRPPYQSPGKRLLNRQEKKAY